MRTAAMSVLWQPKSIIIFPCAAPRAPACCAGTGDPSRQRISPRSLRMGPVARRAAGLGAAVAPLRKGGARKRVSIVSRVLRNFAAPSPLPSSSGLVEACCSRAAAAERFGSSPLPSSSGLVEAALYADPHRGRRGSHRCRRAAASLKHRPRRSGPAGIDVGSPLPSSSGLVEASLPRPAPHPSGSRSPLPSSSGLVEADSANGG